MKIRYLVVFLLAAFVGCSSLPYVDDSGFSNSSQANSPEAPVYIDGHLCKDYQGNPGLCSKRIKSTDTLSFHIDPQQYAYNLNISCESPVTPPPSISVPANSPADFTMSGPFALPNFVCLGEIFPQDRPQPLSAIWEVRISLSDSPSAPTTQDVLMVNGVDCQDSDGSKGFCSLRVKSDGTITFSTLPQTFAYNLTVACSPGMTSPVPSAISVESNTSASFSIAAPFSLESFVCEGEMTPATGPSLHWDVRTVVTDKDYIPREAISFAKQGNDTYLVLGQYALYSWVYDGKNWSSHSKDTMIKISDPLTVKAYSESDAMRYNFLNMDTPVIQGN